MIDDSILHSDNGIFFRILLDYCLNSTNLFVANDWDKLSCNSIDIGELFSSCDSLSICCEDS